MDVQALPIMELGSKLDSKTHKGTLKYLGTKTKKSRITENPFPKIS